MDGWFDGGRMGRRAVLARWAALALTFWSGSAAAQRSSPRYAPHDSPWDEELEVAITFRVGDERTGATRRPYVAVFIEDPQGRAVRTVSLWAQKQVAWVRHLRHWYRGEVARQSLSGGNLIDTLTSATRRPGEYTVVWDGKDNEGRFVEQGEYFVCIESVRQGSSAYLVRQSFRFGTEPFAGSIEDFAAIQGITVELRRQR